MKVLLTYFVGSWLIQVLLTTFLFLTGIFGEILYLLYALPWVFISSVYPGLKPFFNESSLYLIILLTTTVYSILFTGVFGVLHLWLIGNKVKG